MVNTSLDSKKSIFYLFQIIDISDKILYSEVKAENFFVTLINAAVSHELRNPLNSLINQFPNMQDFFGQLDQMIELI